MIDIQDIHLHDTKHMSNTICLCFVEICNTILHDFAEYHGSYRRLGLQFRQKPLQWFGLRKPKDQTSQDGNNDKRHKQDINILAKIYFRHMDGYV